MDHVDQIFVVHHRQSLPRTTPRLHRQNGFVMIVEFSFFSVDDSRRRSILAEEPLVFRHFNRHRHDSLWRRVTLDGVLRNVRVRCEEYSQNGSLSGLLSSLHECLGRTERTRRYLLTDRPNSASFVFFSFQRIKTSQRRLRHTSYWHFTCSWSIFCSSICWSPCSSSSIDREKRHIDCLVLFCSKSFQDVVEIQSEIWNFQQYTVVREYYDRSPLFIPLSTILDVIALTKMFYRWYLRVRYNYVNPTQKVFGESWLNEDSNGLVQFVCFQLAEVIAARPELEHAWREFESASTYVYAQEQILSRTERLIDGFSDKIQLVCRSSVQGTSDRTKFRLKTRCSFDRRTTTTNNRRDKLKRSFTVRSISCVKNWRSPWKISETKFARSSIVELNELVSLSFQLQIRQMNRNTSIWELRSVVQ